MSEKAWRQHMRAEVRGIDNDLSSIKPKNGQIQDLERIQSMLAELSGILHPAETQRSREARRRAQEDARSLLTEVRRHLVLVLPCDTLAARLPALLAEARRHLPPDDARLVRAERLVRRPHQFVHLDGHGIGVRNGLDQVGRKMLSEIVRDTKNSELNWYRNSRDFRDRLIRLFVITTAILLALVAVAALFGWSFWSPRDSTAGTSIDPAHPGVVVAVALMGAVGGFLSGVRGVARQKVFDVFDLPLWQMLLKLPIGGLTAVVGVLALQATMMPGAQPVRELESVLVWAVAFGAAQQAVTHWVDQRVRSIASTPQTEGADAEVTKHSDEAPPPRRDPSPHSPEASVRAPTGAS
jgi:hypothetical protein